MPDATCALVAGTLLAFSAGIALASENDAKRTDLSRALQLAQRGECRPAIPLLEHEYEKSRREIALLWLAKCHERLGDRDTAIVYYERVVRESTAQEVRAEAREALLRLRQSRPNSEKERPDRETQPRFLQPGALVGSQVTQGGFALMAGVALDVGTHFELSVTALAARGWGVRPALAGFLTSGPLQPAVLVGFPIFYDGGEWDPALEPMGGIRWGFHDYVGLFIYAGVVYSFQAAFDTEFLTSAGIHVRF